MGGDRDRGGVSAWLLLALMVAVICLLVGNPLN